MKKTLFSLIVIFCTINAFSQNTTSVFNTTGNLSSGIGTTTLPKVAGYTGLVTNNPKLGGYLDFMQNNSLRGSILGDNHGLSLEVPLGYGTHIWTNGKEDLTLLTNGFVGIGTTAPVSKLDVLGSFMAGGKVANISPKNANGNLSYLAGSGQLLIGWNRTGGQGETDFISNMGNGSIGGFAFFNYGDGTTKNTTTTELMRITSSGQVIIGSSSWSSKQALGSNMLAVGGGVLTEAVIVKTQTNWPDYVFESAYQLPALNNVKSYISANHHLPELPSAAEITGSGQNLGEMNQLLLKKVEELTLYVIQKDDQLTDQQKQLDAQNKQLALQGEEIKTLETAMAKLASK